ncbi:hypothetical protein HPULCUR_003286 [Helicostylum pulchrum]|uniref:RGS domain-containing protein n=1 Tax=Helicostylum pulchrum TaxID=562976 RepID=A0ABP9XU81_9FUNG
MSVPFGDSPSMVYHTIVKSVKSNKKQQSLPQISVCDNTRVSPSPSTATSKLEENNQPRTENNNYDISYYFNPSSSATTHRKSEQQEEAVNSNRSNTNLPYRTRSLSIGSTISAHYMNNTPSAVNTASAFNEYYPPGTPTTTTTTTTTSSSKDVFPPHHTSTEKSNKKADQFFGEQVKLQVTAKEVRKEGLKALLYSTAPLGYFLYHLLNEYSSENLFFYLAVDNYQSYNFPNHIERQQVANKIAKAYLTRNSDLEVNLEDRISRAVKKALLEQQRQPSLSTGNEFDAAKRHVFSLLNVSYHRFRVSSIWDIMEAKCDGYNRDRAQALVVNVLLSFVKRHNNPSLFKLVHSFCRIYLPYGYDFRSSGIGIGIGREELITKEVTNRRSRSKSLGGSDKKGNFISSKIDNIFSKR